MVLYKREIEAWKCTDLRRYGEMKSGMLGKTIVGNHSHSALIIKSRGNKNCGAYCYDAGLG